MADKIAGGAWHEGGPAQPPQGLPGDEGQQAGIDRLRGKRDAARWAAVVGFGLLFGGSFSSAFVFGGVAMILYGATASVWWSTRLRKAQGDPWDYDPDLDGPRAPAWSREGRPPSKDDDAQSMEHDQHP